MPIVQGDVAVQREARDAAEKERAELLPRIPMLRIVVLGPSARRVRVLLDGSPVDSALVGVFMVVNPGAHVVTAGPGARLTQRVEIQEGRRETLRFDVPEVPSEAGVDTPEWSVDMARARSVRLTSAATLGAIGVVGIATGAATSLVAAARWSATQDACPGLTMCPSNRGHELAAEAHDIAQAANVAYVFGGSALLGAAMLWAAAPSRAAASVRVGVGPAGVAASGEF
jgi:hypothetical protein